MPRRKYQTAICAIAKDEDSYVLEWAAYHLAIGFDHIFLYDNMSAASLADRFASPAAQERITVIRWPSIQDRDSQLAAYEHFLWTYGSEVEWTAVIDIDEFINLKQHADIRAFLKPFADATGVALNWRFFGSSGEAVRRSGLVMERFTRAAPIEFRPNRTVKAIYRTFRVSLLCHHVSGYHGEARVRSADGSATANEAEVAIAASNFAVAQINHYFVKSREEWQRKVKRGYSWQADDRTDAFDQYDRNECEDATILPRKAETERWMAVIGGSAHDRARPSAGARLLTGWAQRLIGRRA